uniref:Uncharacterized protein n=1 Tax=Candidatus Kentrum sp. SD TaxID=2126332 RepID=A0A450YCJ3_9GAMM|nr:MAG: hypothetical protein BECKSD772F_GA0070984_103519 [Candidatus Kentron sp. SD]VFK44112.1 MAG: hypothetical protein BECKSD772E_GA0070983_103319 [Candidatus Kentron sp. SD]
MLILARDWPDSFVYFPLGFTNGFGFNDPLLARNDGSLVRGEASLGIFGVEWLGKFPIWLMTRSIRIS